VEPVLSRTYLPFGLHHWPAHRVTVVTLEGEVDIAVSALLQHVFPDLVSSTSPHIAIDLRRVDFMDCSALGAFVLAYRSTAAVGGRLRIVGAQPQPRRLLSMTGLDAVFPLYEDLDSAFEGVSA
jgi:anti-sigma B factor antagonist